MALDPTTSGNAGGSSSILFIKICFTSPGSAQRGVALIRINETGKSVESVDALASLNSQYIDNISTMSPAVSFLDFLKNHRFKMDFNQKTSLEVSNALKQVLDGQSAMEKGAIAADFIQFARKKNSDAVLHALQPYLSRALYDKKLDMDLSLEFSTQAEVDEYFAGQEADRMARTEPVAEAAPVVDDFFNLGDDKVVLLSHPVLSPVTGVPITSLKAGLDIMVRIDNNTVLGNKYNTLFNLVGEDGRIQPRSGTVQAVRSDPDGHKILVLFQGNTYGKIIETEPVKVKMSEAAAGPEAEKVPVKSRLITMALVAGFVVGLAILVAVFIKA